MVSVINTLTLYNDRQEYFTKISAEWRVYENTENVKDIQAILCTA